MKLADLNPEWVDSNVGKKIGIICDCPCGKCDEMRRLWVPFLNPVEGPRADPFNGWNRTGDTFETLTLTPSIRRLEGCQWHGFITNGEIITV